jgi:RNA polymerase sigma-70 factor (ECF subfamily)
MSNAIRLRMTRIQPIDPMPAVPLVDHESAACCPAIPAADEAASLATEILQIAGGDAAALSDLYDLTIARLYSIARSVLQCPYDAEEVVCDVFLFVWRNSQRYDPARGSVMGWLSIITRSRSIDRLRKRRGSIWSNHREASRHAGSSTDDTETPEGCLRRFEANSHVSRVLALQPPVRRTLIALAFFHGLCHEEIARTTGLPLGSVKSHIRRALKSMRTVLEIGSVQPTFPIKPGS